MFPEIYPDLYMVHPGSNQCVLWYRLRKVKYNVEPQLSCNLAKLPQGTRDLLHRDASP